MFLTIKCSCGSEFLSYKAARACEGSHKLPDFDKFDELCEEPVRVVRLAAVDDYAAIADGLAQLRRAAAPLPDWVQDANRIRAALAIYDFHAPRHCACGLAIYVPISKKAKDWCNLMGTPCPDWNAYVWHTYRDGRAAPPPAVFTITPPTTGVPKP
jgi:hypothetical protein